MTKKCPNCGESLVSSDIYCPYCSADTRPAEQSSGAYSFAQPAAPQGSITCESCGSANEPQNLHCANCGANIASSQPYAPPATNTGYTTIGSTPTSETHTYGASSTASDDRPWYKPPHRERSAKRPREWFFWTGWGLYIFFRVLFSILFIVLRVAARSRK